MGLNPGLIFTYISCLWLPKIITRLNDMPYTEAICVRIHEMVRHAATWMAAEGTDWMNL
ncbi:hypothetical protein J21TS3_43600 [Paenibacillus cookii]|uniref:Uncharacterized protein n=1 Tax=Paenibacillus cookii TaxID=157839 RepID=A0ABQ4M288_9BACL|nr:hypothetical protein J21TS3_43600 [Paenibacillus cookii]